MSTSYDFEIKGKTPSGQTAWQVFNANTGKNVCDGHAPTADIATRAALTAICHLDGSRRYVLRIPGGWALWVADHEAWVAIPLTRDADSEQAREYVAHLPATHGRAVVVFNGYATR